MRLEYIKVTSPSRNKRIPVINGDYETAVTKAIKAGMIIAGPVGNVKIIHVVEERYTIDESLVKVIEGKK